MRLVELQRWMSNIVMRPLTPEDRFDRSQLSTNSATVDKIISPSARLTAVERLEVYNRGFWFRVLDSMREDFPAVRAFTGEEQFKALVVRYVSSVPSTHWTLRNLGMRFEPWLRASASSDESLLMAADIARLEWAYIEAYDAPELPGLDLIQLQRPGPVLKLRLQPHVQLVHTDYTVQGFITAIHDGEDAPPASFPKRVEFLAVYRQELSVNHTVLTPLGSLVLHGFRHWQSLEDVFTMDHMRRAVGPDDIPEIARQFHEWGHLGFFASRQDLNEESNG
jgi:hypothetical protein